MKNGILLSAAIACVLFHSGLAGAHARLVPTSLVSLRNTNTGNKVGPCGAGARNAKPTILQPGQQLKVDWEEVVDHPGYYRIAFSPSGDAGFDQNILADRLPDMQGGDINKHKYSATVTVPTTPCTGCTLQLIQYMTESSPPSLYYSCADIEIRAGASTYVPAPPPVGAAPLPNEACGD